MGENEDGASRVVDWLGLRGGNPPPGPGDPIPMWYGVSKPRYILISAGWVAVAVIVFFALRHDSINSDWRGLPLVVSLMTFALGMAVTERLMLKSPR